MPQLPLLLVLVLVLVLAPVLLACTPPPASLATCLDRSFVSGHGACVPTLSLEHPWHAGDTAGSPRISLFASEFCVGGRADLVLFTAPAAGTFRFSTDNAGTDRQFDTVIYVTTADCRRSRCANDFADVYVTQSSADFALAAGEQVAIAVGAAQVGPPTGRYNLTVAAAPVPDPERLAKELDALAAVYAATAPWIRDSGWAAAATPPCSWTGIVCTKDGHVAVVQLPNNGMHGSWPEVALHLADLADLRVVVLSNNSLTGPLTSSLAGLDRLYSLILSENRLSGPAHVSLELPPAIETVWLDTNPALGGSLDVGISTALPLLRSLSLHTTSVTGTLPPDTSALPDLSELYLSDSLLGGPLPALPPSLEVLVADRCLFTGEIVLHTAPDLAYLSVNENMLTSIDVGNVTFERLTVIWLAHNHIDGPLRIEAFRAVQVLVLANNLLTGALPAAGYPASVRHLHLHGNPGLAGAIPQAVFSPRLEQVTFSYCAFSSLPSSLSSSPGLVYLALRENALTALPASLSDDLPVLSFLDVSANDLEALPPALPARLSELQVAQNPRLGALPATLPDTLIFLTADGCALRALPDLPATLDFLLVSDNVLTELPPLPRGLRRLDVSDNALEGSVLPLVPTLQWLDVSRNALSVVLPSDLPTDLSGLLLSGNVVRGGLPQLPASLEYLEAADCGLDGPLGEATLGPELVSFEAPRNSLTGTLPLLAANLVVLNLVDNLLSGPIPHSPGDLEFLRLSHNCFGPSIRASLPEEMPRLQILALDHNCMSTPLPSAWIHFEPTLGSPRDLREPSTFSVLPRLVDIDLSANPMTGVALEDVLLPLRALISLGRLACRGCGLAGSGMHILTEPFEVLDVGETFRSHVSFKGLVYLDLGDNSALSDPLPEEPPDSLVTLLADGTGIEGSVPGAWFDRVAVLDFVGTGLDGGNDWDLWLTATGEFAEFALWRCPELVGIAGLVKVDPGFAGLDTCECAPGTSGVPPLCEPCALDHAAAGYGASECTECPEGGSTDGQLGSDECICRGGWSQVGPTTCAECPVGMFSNQAGAPECSVCADGTSSLAGAQSCFACPVEVRCVGGILEPRDGWWWDDTAPITPETEFFQCHPQDVCGIGMGPDTFRVACADGYEGVLCGECSEGWGRYSGQCFECFGRAAATSVMLATTCAFLVWIAWLVRAAQRSAKSTASVVFRIWANHIQCLVIVAAYPWATPLLPVGAIGAGGAASASDFSAGLLFPLNCILSDVTYHTEHGAALAIPFVLVALAAGALMVLRRPGDIVAAALVILQQLHAQETRLIVGFFDCVTVDESGPRHARAIGEFCSGPTHNALYALNMTAAVLYVVGLPVGLMLAIWVLVRAGRLYEDPLVMRRFGFLYSPFRRPRKLEFPIEVFYEGIVVARKLALVAIGASDGTAVAKGAAAMWVVAVAIALSALIQPFRKPIMNVAEGLELMALLTVLATGVAGGSRALVWVAEAGVAVLVVAVGAGKVNKWRRRRVSGGRVSP